MLFTDTDSLVHESKTDDINEGFYKYKNFFDFRDYPHSSESLHPTNKKVIGKMKDKFKGKIIS